MNHENERDLRIRVAKALEIVGPRNPADVLALSDAHIDELAARIFGFLRLDITNDQMSQLVRHQIGEMRESLAAMVDDDAKSRSADWIPEIVTKNSGMLSTYLDDIGARGWDAADTARLRLSVLATLGAIGNPHVSESTYGLVVGRVQSGKTTHYVALILAALAAGYRRVLVLGGHTNSLRAQCQRRLRSAIHSMTPAGVKFATPDFVTGDQEGEDFTERTALNKEPEGAQIFVCKKNVTPLKAFSNILGTSPLSLLVIDDEADWGTQNVARDPEQEQSQLNELIHEIIGDHPTSHRAYIAYTATPYANLLVSEADAGAIMPQYVRVISPGRGYLGNDTILGNDDDEDDFLPVFVDRKRTNPRRGGLKKLRTDPNLRLDLENAIAHYMLAAAGYRVIASDIAGQSRAKPRAKMLINDSTLKDCQEDIRWLASKLVKEVTHDVLIEEESRLLRLQELWESNYVSNWIKFSERLDDITSPPPEWTRLKPHLVAVANALVPGYGLQDQHIRIINSDNDAWTASATADRDMEMIYVGGMVFARGVTIEGLTTVLFAASPGQQDTLLQYARWLGYRGNFAPLLRVLLPRIDQEAYAEIAQLDRKLWKFLKQACEQGISPAEAQIIVPRESNGVVSRPTSPAKTRMAVMTLESRMLEPVLWEPGIVDGAHFPPWNSAGLELLAKSKLIKEHDDATHLRLYYADSDALLEYIAGLSETGGSRTARMQMLEDGLRRIEECAKTRTQWIVACPLAGKEPSSIEEGFVAQLQRQLCGWPRIAARKVHQRADGVARSHSGNFSGTDDRAFDFKVRSSDATGIELAVKALVRSFRKQGKTDIWEGGHAIDLTNAAKLTTIDKVKVYVIDALKKDLQDAAKKKTWDRWLRCPGQALCVLQVFDLEVVDSVEPRIPLVMLPAMLTPRSAVATFGMVPRERVDL